MARKKTIPHPKLKPMNVGAAAIDIGSTMHMAAVNPEHSDEPIRAFGTFTHDLHDLADWFASCGVTSVAMESTGVYWIPAFEILEQHGFDVIVHMACDFRWSSCWLHLPFSPVAPSLGFGVLCSRSSRDKATEYGLNRLPSDIGPVRC